MARPPKKRYVCCLPQTRRFAPDQPQSPETICLTVEEYETIRLIDLEACTQEQCAAQMHVARTTVQSIYNTARKKLADTLVNGKSLHITGGDYRLCERYTPKCGKGCCQHCHRHLCGLEPDLPEPSQKEETNMKIAVTYENGQIFQHFGHSQQFKLYEVADKTVTDARVVDTMGSGHGCGSHTCGNH